MCCTQTQTTWTVLHHLTYRMSCITPLCTKQSLEAGAARSSTWEHLALFCITIEPRARHYVQALRNRIREIDTIQSKLIAAFIECGETLYVDSTENNALRVLLRGSQRHRSISACLHSFGLNTQHHIKRFEMWWCWFNIYILLQIIAKLF